MELSPEAQTLKESIRLWFERLPAGTVRAVRMNEKFLEPWEDDFGTELIITFLPFNIKSSRLQISSPSDKECVILDGYERIAERENLVVPWFCSGAWVASVIPDPWTYWTNERMIEVCEAVAQGRIELTLGIAFRRIICAHGRINLPSASIDTGGIAYFTDFINFLSFMPLIKWLSNYGLGEVHSVEFEPWANAAERHP